MKQHALPAAATTTTAITLAAFIWHRLDILIIAAATSTVLWVSYRMNHLAARINNGVGETRAEVGEYARHTGVAKLLEAAGQPIGGEPLTLPTPQGSIRPIATTIDDETVIFGVDAATDLADVIDLRAAIADRDGEAAL